MTLNWRRIGYIHTLIWDVVKSCKQTHRDIAPLHALFLHIYLIFNGVGMQKQSLMAGLMAYILENNEILENVIQTKDKFVFDNR